MGSVDFLLVHLVNNAHPGLLPLLSFLNSFKKLYDNIYILFELF